MPILSFPELLLILIIALIIFGPGKIPSAGTFFVKAINKIKKSLRE